jgi:ABC-type lipoprotein release transport system permease subunit
MRALLVLHLAIENVVSHRAKSLVIAVVLALDALLLVLGGSLLTSMTERMRTNVTASLAGDIHLFSATAESLDIFDMEGGADGLPAIADYASVAQAIALHPNVSAIVPMSTASASARVGNRLDRLFERSRRAAAANDREGLRALADELAGVLGRLRRELRGVGDEVPEARAWLTALERTAPPSFWQDFLARPLEILERLENEVAPIGGEPATIAFSYIASDPAIFARAFSRFELVKGQPLSAGSGGVLLNERFYERSFKHPVAHGLDLLAEESETGGLPAAIVAARLQQLGSQAASLVRAVVPGGEERLRAALTQHLGPASTQSATEELVGRFFDFPPEALGERRRWFYEHVAPQIELYSVSLGDRLTIQASSARGEPVAVNAHVLGLYRFRGLEEFGLANAFALIDPALHADLRGVEDDGLAEEMAALRRASGAADVDRAGVESALFGTSTSIESTTQVAGSLDFRIERTARRAADASSMTVEHAAIVLRDAEKLQSTLAELRALGIERGWQLRAVPWQAAAGVVAQYFGLVQLQLYIGLGIAWLVAMLIVNVAIVVVTLERTREIGTLRAMGASSSFILALVIVETLILALLAVAIGTGVGAAIVAWLGERGLPAIGPALTLLFGGARLYPSLALAYVMGALVTTCTIGVLAALYPARLATRVQPVLALRQVT